MATGDRRQATGDSDTKDKEFQVIASAHDDCRRLIAAGKVQLWDVVKWGVTVNTALAAAAAGLALPPAQARPHMDGVGNAWNNAPACVLGTVWGTASNGTWRFRSARAC